MMLHLLQSQSREHVGGTLPTCNIRDIPRERKRNYYNRFGYNKQRYETLTSTFEARNNSVNIFTIKHLVSVIFF